MLLSSWAGLDQRIAIRHAQMGHPIEHVAANPHLGALHSEQTRPQMVPKDGFQAKNGRFRQRMAMMVGSPFPGAAAMAAHIAQVLIAGMGRCFAVAMLPDAGIPAGGNGDLSARSVRLDRLIDAVPVVGAIARCAGNRVCHLLQHGRERLRIRHTGVRHFHGLNFPAPTVHRKVNLALGAPLRSAVLTHFPLAFAIELQPPVVEHEVQRTCRPFGQTHLRRSTLLRQGGVIRHGQRHLQKLKQRTHASLGAPVGQVKDFSKDQHRLDRLRTVNELSPALGRPGSAPIFNASSDTQTVSEPRWTNAWSYSDRRERGILSCSAGE